MRKVIKDGNVAVLYSPGFGAGWSTWNDMRADMVFCPEIVEKILSGEEVTVEFCKEIFNCDDNNLDPKGEHMYFDGASDLEVVWLYKGTVFTIDEYDGSESLNIQDDMDWFVA